MHSETGEPKAAPARNGTGEWTLSRALGALGLGTLALGYVTPEPGDGVGKWAVYAALLVAAVTLVATRQGAFFGPDRYGASVLARVLAGGLLLLFLVGGVFTASLGLGLLGQMLVLGCLWLSVTVLAAVALKDNSDDVDLSGPAICAGMGLGGVPLLLAAAGPLREGEALLGVAVLLGGLALLLVGMSLLREGLDAVGLLLGGSAGLFSGVAFLRDGLVLVGAGSLLIGVVVLLLGLSLLLRNGWVLLLFSFPMLGIAGLLLGLANLWEGRTLLGVGYLLLGVVGLLFVAEPLWEGETLFGVGVLLIGIAFVVFGVAFLRQGMILGAGLLLGGVAVLVVGAAVLRDANMPLVGRLKGRLLRIEHPATREP